MSTTRLLKRTTSTPRCSATTGYVIRVMRTAGASEGISWGVRSSTTGMNASLASLKDMGKKQMILQNHLTGFSVSRFDPSGFIMEHYVDGDLLDMTEETHHTPASPDNLHVWGEFLFPASDIFSTSCGSATNPSVIYRTRPTPYLLDMSGTQNGRPRRIGL